LDGHDQTGDEAGDVNEESTRLRRGVQINQRMANTRDGENTKYPRSRRVARRGEQVEKTQ